MTSAASETPPSTPRDSSAHPTPNQARVARDLTVLALATVACLAPLLNKALDTDDTLFVWSAQQIQKRPLDFYGFEVNWGLTVVPMHRETKNPPWACYYLAAAGSLMGWSEAALHSAMWVPALLAIWGTYALARKCGAPPLWSALATLATPVFLVSAGMLMCDVWMLAFWLLALSAWMHGLERRRWRWLALAGVCMGLAMWSKYFAVALVPLAAVYTWSTRGLRTIAYLWLLVPAIMLLAYEYACFQLYGAGMLAQAIDFAREVGPWAGTTSVKPLDNTGGTPLAERVWVGLVFAGGCCLPLATYHAVRWRTIGWASATFAATLVGLTLYGVEQVAHYWMWPNGRLDLSMHLHQTLFGIVGAVLAIHAGSTLWRRRDAVTLLLAIWLVGTLVFAAVVNWTCNGRSILPLVPAAAILILRDLHIPAAATWQRRAMFAAPLAAGLVLSMVVAYGGAATANADREMARQLLRDYPPASDRPVWFQGHWGWQYYLEAGGARPIDFKRAVLQKGEVILTPEVNSNVATALEPATRRVEVRMADQSRWATTMSFARGASFHASVFGPLPYRLGPAPPLKYQVRSPRRLLTISDQNSPPGKSTRP